MSWFRNITRSGLLPTDAYQHRRAILLSNYISLVLCACMLLLFLLRRLVFGHIPGGMDTHSVLIGLTCAILPVILNRLQWTTLSRLLMCYTPVCFMWYVYVSDMRAMPLIEQAVYDSMRIHFLAVSFIPYLLLDIKKPWWLILGILPTLISLLFLDAILAQAGVGIHQRGVPGEQASLVGIRTFVSYCLINISCFIFQSIIRYNDELNKRILSELKLRSEEIKAQNEELVQSQERLSEINQHLEDLVLQKTASIQAQNDRILKYAYANAHHVRGPIARLLGLVQLVKVEAKPNYPWFFEKVEQETVQADEIITSIARELDEIGRQA